jgi:hypothetical protein
MRTCGIKNSSRFVDGDVTLEVSLPGGSYPESPSVELRIALGMLKEDIQYGDDVVVVRSVIAGGENVGARSCAVANLFDPERGGSYSIAATGD